MQSQIILLSNVKQDNIAQLVQKEFEMLGITNIKGKRIDADRSAIHKNVAEALADYNIIMVIGGMEKEGESITASAVSSAIGFGTVTQGGETFPEGAEIFRNKHGKACGCAVSQGNQCIIMLPGDPESLQFMLCYRVSKYLADFAGGEYSNKTLRAAGITKAEAEDAVSAAETAGTSVRIYEDGGEIAIRVFAKAETRKEAAAKVNDSLKSIISKVGNAAYAVGAENIGQAFGQELSKKDLKVAFAIEGIQKNEISSAIFTEEYIGNYLGTSVGVKKYDIPEKLLKRHGANSAWTAAVLAGEVGKTYGANMGISITTDPTKNNEGANIAVCMGDNVWTEHITAETRDELIAAAGARAVSLARSVASAYPKLFENSVSLMGAASGKERFKTGETKQSGKWYSRFIPMKGDPKSEIIRKSIFILCIVIFLGCMGYLSTKLFDNIDQKNMAAEFKDIVTGETQATEEELREWGYNPSLYDLYQINNDLIAYISIDNTNVSFPVVQTSVANDKGHNGQYYLRKDYYGNYSMYGTPFLDYRCSADPEAQSKNLIVYGHNVYNDGEMFSDLIKYRQLRFYKEHPVVHFNTLYGDFDWLVVGVILTNAYEKDGPVWDYNNFITGNDEEMKEFLNQVAKRTMIVTGVDYNVSDNYLTLSTCSYDFTDARVVIIARQVREGEDISALDTSKAYYNSNPLMPDKWYQAVSEAQQNEADATFGDAEEIVDAEEILDISLFCLPKKTTYKVGESLDTTGMVLKVHTAEETIEVKDGYTFVPEGPFTEPGTHTVNIYYDNFVVTFDVKVEGEGEGNGENSSGPSEEAAVTGIEILEKPDKTEYKVGEKLSTKGLVIRVHKNDDTFEDIYDITENNSKGVLFSPTLSSEFISAGEYTIKVTFDDYSANFKIKVTAEAKVTAIEILEKPDKTVYTEGESLDTKGLVLRVTKSDGSTEDITEGFSVAPNGALNAAGEYTITVSFEGFSATFKVRVNKPVEELPSQSETPSAPEQSGSSGNSSGNSSGSGSSSGNSGSSGNSSSGSASSNNTASTTYANESPYYLQSTRDTVRVNGTTMSVYDAVCLIVAFEAGQGQPEEHVKAQAVATYTYLMNSGGSVSAGISYQKLDSQIKRCVAEVIGYAVLDNRSHDFILATYFSESCGATAAAEWVWGYPNRNLLSVSSPVDGKTEKTYSISSADFAAKVKSKAGITLSGNPSGWISIESYWGGTDYVNQVNLGGTKYSARKLRETVLGGSSLRSTAFDVRYDSASDKFIFTMRGYGHGVGLSAVGSIAYAKMGYSWEQILLKYYSNCYVGMKY